MPIELFELSKRYSDALLVVTITNVFIVYYLFVNRNRLFHRHLPSEPDSP